MENLPIYISLIFIATALLTLYIFYHAVNKSNIVLGIILSWLILQTFIGLSGFYTVTNTLPPRFALLIAPALLTIIILFITKQGRKFIDSLNLKILTLLHIVRIPVEVVLLLLFFEKVVPQVMTFEGRNFDIIAGLSAPVIFYFAHIKQKLSPKMLLIWNFICLGLLFNIVITAILSAPTPFQQLAFDQPNIAVFHFPFLLLPGFIVPVVLLSHLAAIRQLIINRKKKKINF